MKPRDVFDVYFKEGRMGLARLKAEGELVDYSINDKGEIVVLTAGHIETMNVSLDVGVCNDAGAKAMIKLDLMEICGVEGDYIDRLRADIKRLREENRKLRESEEHFKQIAIEQLARRLYQDHYAEMYSYKHTPTHRPFDPFLKDAASYVTGDIHTEWTRKEDYDKLREAVISERAARIFSSEHTLGSEAYRRAESELRAEGVIK